MVSVKLESDPQLLAAADLAVQRLSWGLSGTCNLGCAGVGSAAAESSEGCRGDGGEKASRWAPGTGGRYWRPRLTAATPGGVLIPRGNTHKAKCSQH